MHPNDFVKITRLINDCPNCKSDDIGEGEGALLLKDEVITRTCKCGFSLTYDARKGTTKPKIKKAIDEALLQMTT